MGGASSLVVFGAFGTPAARLLERLREAHPASLCVAWRHLPHPHATGLALAAEAAGPRGASGR